MDEFLLSHISPTLYEDRGPGEDLSSPNSIEIPVESMSTKVKEREKSLPSALDTNALMLICNTYQEGQHMHSFRYQYSIEIHHSFRCQNS